MPSFLEKKRKTYPYPYGYSSGGGGGSGGDIGHARLVVPDSYVPIRCDLLVGYSSFV